MRFRIPTTAATLCALLAAPAAAVKVSQGAWPNLIAYFDASMSPNSTAAVPFKPFSDDEWSWRVNVSTLATPSDVQTTSSNDRIVQTAHSLTWPGGGSLDDALDGSTLSVTTLLAPILKSVANRYSEGDNGDCAPVLGQECADALARALGAGVQALEECREMWPQGIEDQTVDSAGVPSAELMITGSSIVSGDKAGEGEDGPTKVPNGNDGVFMFLDAISDPYARGDDDTMFSNAETMLHIISVSTGDDADSQLLCMRINDKQLDASNEEINQPSDSEDEEDSSNADGGDDGDGNAAAAIGVKSKGILLGMMGVVAFGLLS